MQNNTQLVDNLSGKEHRKSLSRTSALFGVGGAILMAVAIVVRIIFGTGYIGFTAAGIYLRQHGFSRYWADVLDFGHASPLMAVATLIGLVALILGLVALIRIAIFRKGEISLALVGIVTGTPLPVYLTIVAMIMGRGNG